MKMLADINTKKPHVTLTEEGNHTVKKKDIQSKYTSNLIPLHKDFIYEKGVRIPNVGIETRQIDCGIRSF